MSVIYLNHILIAIKIYLMVNFDGYFLNSSLIIFYLAFIVHHFAVDLRFLPQ